SLPGHEKQDDDNDKDDVIEEEQLKRKTKNAITCTESGAEYAFHPEKDASGFQNVFATAVTEESLEAARLRSQLIFFSGDWNSGRHQREDEHTRIVARKASEHYQQALRLKEERNPVGSISCLTKAINLTPSDPVLYAERGEAYLSLCDFQSAILNYRKACLLTTTDKEAYDSRLAFIYYFQGQTLFDQRLFPEALEVFSKAAEMVPGNGGYQMRIITCLVALQRHHECLTLVNQRLQEDKNNPDLYIVRARLHEIFANLSPRYYDVRNALSLNPDHQEGQAMMDTIVKAADDNKNLALHLSIMGKDKQALQKISLAIQMNPSVAEYHVLRGTLHRKLKDFNGAVDDLRLALDKCDHRRSHPVYRNSQRQLLLTFNDFAVECFSKGRYEEAITLLNKALQDEKQEKSLYINRGDCFYKKNELLFAMEDYLQALELDPQDTAIMFRLALVHNEFAVSHFDDKNYTAAETEFTQALECSPLVGQFYVSRSRARSMLGDLTGAREDCLWGLLLSPTSSGNTSIMARLFPGKSMADILNSPAANAVKIKVHALLSVNCSRKLDQPEWNNPANTEGDTNPGTSGFEPAADQSRLSTKALYQQESEVRGYSLCMTDRELLVKEVQEKKKVESRVKDALFNRRPLHADGPKLLPLPSLITLPPNVARSADRLPMTTGTEDKEVSEQNLSFTHYRPNWRQFSHTVRAVKNM
ncbi:unnamed protein product, partial [Candidula unifasciata]